MSCRKSRVATALLGAMIFAHSPQGLSITADEVMQKALNRAAHRDGEASQSSYIYSKVMVTEELDTSGKVKNREEKLYDVVYDSGATTQNLRAINGKPVATAVKKQPDTETKIYKSFGSSKSGKGDRRETLLTPELIGRFEFTLVGQTPMNGRPAYQLAFGAKTNAAVGKHFADRVLARVSGTVWIDAEDFEIARADLRLTSPVDVLGGVLGTLKKMAVSLVRTRLPDGQWLSTGSSGDFQGRKLFEVTSVRTSSRSWDFRPARN